MVCVENKNAQKGSLPIEIESLLKFLGMICVEK